MKRHLASFRIAPRLLVVTAALGWLSTACGPSRACTKEEAENGDTLDCSSDVELVTYTAGSDDTVTLSQTWESGVALELEGAVRELTIVEGDSDDVEITYRAQAELADGRPESFVRNTMDALEVSFEKRGDVLRFQADHPSSNAALGAIVSVALPRDFDADLVVQKYDAPGDVAIEFVGQARSLDVDMESDGAELLVQDTGALTMVRLNASGNVETAAFASRELEQVVINSERGHIVTTFDRIPRSHATLITGKLDDGVLKDTGGDVELRLPADGDFSLASYTKNKARFMGADACEQTRIAYDIHTLDCGSGDVDGLLTFLVQSGGDIDVELR